MENVHGAETRSCECSGEISRKRLLFNFQGESLSSRCQIAEGPPVPIPNTEVKLRRAEDTLPATVRENRSMPTFPRGGPEGTASRGKAKRMGTYGGVAQLGEHLPCKQGVMGSNPIISTKATHEWRHKRCFMCRIRRGSGAERTSGGRSRPRKTERAVRARIESHHLHQQVEKPQQLNGLIAQLVRAPA